MRNPSKFGTCGQDYSRIIIDVAWTIYQYKAGKIEVEEETLFCLCLNRIYFDFPSQSRGQTCEIFKEVDIMLTGYQNAKTVSFSNWKLVKSSKVFFFFPFGNQVFSHFLVFEIIRLEEDG